jgi:exodeoxyribonuclease X
MEISNLIFLDTETTGTGPEDRLCQIAFRMGDEEEEYLFRPPVPIQVEAMAVSHITNKMVADKEPFLGSEVHKKLKDVFSQDVILVAHNARFDIEMLKKEGLEVSRFIDTLKVAHHLDEECAIAKYSLQYLRYFLELEVEDVTPHNALGDVRVLEKLFKHLFEKMIVDSKKESQVIEEMLRVSSLPLLMKKFPFGKYVGLDVADVAKNDPGYLRWLLDKKIEERERGGAVDENWIHTFEHYLK